MEQNGDAAPRVALPGFVSTAVLTSSDGLFGDNVEEQRISEAPAPSAQDAADYKPLYERLQELKDKKDSDWKEKHNPFAPPKALDDEEIQFIRDLEDRQAESQLKRKEQHSEDLAEFCKMDDSALVVMAEILADCKLSLCVVLARESAKQLNGPNAGGSSNSGGAVLSEEALQKYVKPEHKSEKKAPVVVRAKRKVAPKVKSATSKTASAANGAKKQKVDAEKPAVAEAKTKTPSMGLVAYGSDSDDSD